MKEQLQRYQKVAGLKSSLYVCDGQKTPLLVVGRALN